jgi:hypothetical protein
MCSLHGEFVRRADERQPGELRDLVRRRFGEAGGRIDAGADGGADFAQTEDWLLRSRMRSRISPEWLSDRLSHIDIEVGRRFWLLQPQAELRNEPELGIHSSTRPSTSRTEAAQL